jgi:hypothetical protein
MAVPSVFREKCELPSLTTRNWRAPKGGTWISKNCEQMGATGLRVNGGSFSFNGTSCVDPLYAGLTAVLVQALGEHIGFLNPTLYALGNSVCNDITFGNNDPNFNPGTVR